MIFGKTKRPRNVDSARAAAILYGDWGTSKAYVIGLAFAVAGYSSFWLLAAMSVLLALVGINYMAICRHYPDGGGVYASVYHRSKIIAIVGAFLLIADYIVTAAISALSAFQYVGLPHPEIFAGCSDVPAHTVVDLAVKIGATLLILGAPRRHMLVKLIRGNMVRRVSRFLPEEIHLLVYA
jgi:amino acid transporter